MPDIIDDKELSEREEATSALAGEDEKHFVNYCIECARESRDSRKDVLYAMGLLWDAYQNMMDFGDKEEWQSRVVTNKPFAAVERAVAIIGRAFKNPNYLTAEGVEIDDKDVSEHVKKALLFWLDPQHTNFPFKFKNASRMSMAIGLSLEMIPRWENGLMLDSQSHGKYSVTQMPFPESHGQGHIGFMRNGLISGKLRKMGKEDYYINIDKVKEGGTPTGTEGTKEEIERRKRCSGNAPNTARLFL